MNGDLSMRIPRLAIAVVVALGMVLTPTLTAWAATTTFLDQVRETKSSADVRWVKVENARSTDRFGVTVKVNQIRTASTLVVYVDRNLKNAGPELRMVAAPDSEWALYRVGTWGQRGKEITTCGRVRMSAFDREHKATWRASRECLAISGVVRVAVKMTDARGRVDWAPRKRTFFPRVSARF